MWVWPFLWFSLAQCLSFRAPSVPLLTVDPYIQVYSNSNALYESPTTYWDGTSKQFIGLARFGETLYCWCGVPLNSSCLNAVQLSVRVDATSTEFLFGLGTAKLNVTFYNPLFVDQQNQPYGFVSMKPSAQMDLFFATTSELATNDASQLVTLQGDSSFIRAGTVSQDVLGRSGDAVGIDWGYAYLGALSGNLFAGNLSVAQSSFYKTGSVPSASPPSSPQRANDNWPSLCVSFKNAAAQVSQLVSIGYDDIYSINFFGKNLAPSWTQKFANFSSFLSSQMQNADAIFAKCVQVNRHIWMEAVEVGGEQHAQLSALAYRQALAGIKFVVGPNQQEWVFMKEISSDGDISTVDVVFPASPVFLSQNPSLLTKILLPLFAFAANQTSNPMHNYTKIWAPHHLGVWPIADALSTNQEDMPVEESANLILMVAAIVKAQGSIPEELQQYLPLFRQWADYLQGALPDPGDQLCTDDFTGPSPNNVNLAAKGIIALAAYAEFIVTSSDPMYHFYSGVASAYSVYWQIQAKQEADHFSLEFRDPNTWSTKYNLLYQEILQLDVFPPSVFATERSYYLNHQMNQFGVPLDNRANFAKADWLMWMFAGAHIDDFLTVSRALYSFFNTTTSRIPMTDWYFTSSPNAVGPFRARPVMGAVFARQLLQGASRK